MFQALQVVNPMHTYFCRYGQVTQSKIFSIYSFLILKAKLFHKQRFDCLNHYFQIKLFDKAEARFLYSSDDMVEQT